MQILILRFDAPLMSFGGVVVDQHGPTERFPGLSLLTGLLGNAIGLRHGDAEALERLQKRLEVAARWDVPPELLIDYHTVDLGQEKMNAPGWTTRAEPEHRKGADDNKFGTHQRYRHYWANGVMTIALTLAGEEDPSIKAVAQAVRHPARPLFLGRKTCLPATPLLLDEVEASDVLVALSRVPLSARVANVTGGSRVEACWPAGLGLDGHAREVEVYDRRDWDNQVVAGRRLVAMGWLEVGRPA